MDSVHKFESLVPLRLPIMDLVKRTDQLPERDPTSVATWFDKYMRILFGEADTPRYKMMKMAIAMRRALLLFEGLDAAGTVTEARVMNHPGCATVPTFPTRYHQD
eukprot:symbB.v1.2.003740.t1/scaffold191.1/size276526/5